MVESANYSDLHQQCKDKGWYCPENIDRQFYEDLSDNKKTPIIANSVLEFNENLLGDDNLLPVQMREALYQTLCKD